jgi:hypothetical protein
MTICHQIASPYWAPDKTRVLTTPSYSRHTATLALPMFGSRPHWLEIKVRPDGPLAVNDESQIFYLRSHLDSLTSYAYAHIRRRSPTWPGRLLSPVCVWPAPRKPLRPLLDIMRCTIHALWP